MICRFFISRDMADREYLIHRAINLRYVRGLSVEEIARELDIPAFNDLRLAQDA